jgi:hypothetical protein
MSLSAGTKLGTYEVVSAIGAGGMGEVPPDIAENEFSLQNGFRLLSAYHTNAGEKLWLITESDRSSTCILLPEEC